MLVCSITSALLTCLQTKSLGGLDLYWSEWYIIYLYAGDSSTEVALVPNPSSHPYRIVRSQSDPSDSFPSNFSVIDIQSSISRALIISSGDEIPSLGLNKACLHRCCKSSCTGHETYHQNSSTDHPYVHAKPVRLVIEDGTNRTIRIYPS